MDLIDRVRTASLAFLPPIFAECVGEYSPKYDLGAPFIDGDRVVATDGKILAQMPIASLGDFAPALRSILGTMPARKLPKTENMFSGTAWSEDGIPLPGNLSGAVPCPQCKQDRLVRSDTDDYDLWNLCDLCAGSGWFLDPDISVHPSPIHAAKVSLTFAWILKKHGALLYLSDKAIDPILWKIDQVSGFLMPLAKE